MGGSVTMLTGTGMSELQLGLVQSAILTAARRTLLPERETMCARPVLYLCMRTIVGCLTCLLGEFILD